MKISPLSENFLEQTGKSTIQDKSQVFHLNFSFLYLKTLESFAILKKTSGVKNDSIN